MFVPLHGPVSLPGQLEADLVVSQEAVLASVGTLQYNEIFQQIPSNISSRLGRTKIVILTCGDITSLESPRSEEMSQISHVIVAFVVGVTRVVIYWSYSNVDISAHNSQTGPPPLWFVWLCAEREVRHYSNNST